MARMTDTAEQIEKRAAAPDEDGLYVKGGPFGLRNVGYLHAQGPRRLMARDTHGEFWTGSGARANLMNDEAIWSAVDTVPPDDLRTIDFRCFPFLWHQGVPGQETWYEVYLSESSDDTFFTKNSVPLMRCLVAVTWLGRVISSPHHDTAKL